MATPVDLVGGAWAALPRRVTGRVVVPNAACASVTISTCAPGTTATTRTGPSRCCSTSRRDPHETNDLAGTDPATTAERARPCSTNGPPRSSARTGLEDPMDTCARRRRPVPRTQAPQSVPQPAAVHRTRSMGRPTRTTTPQRNLTTSFCSASYSQPQRERATGYPIAPARRRCSVCAERCLWLAALRRCLSAVMAWL